MTTSSAARKTISLVPDWPNDINAALHKTSVAATTAAWTMATLIAVLEKPVAQTTGCAMTTTAALKMTHVMVNRHVVETVKTTALEHRIPVAGKRTRIASGHGHTGTITNAAIVIKPFVIHLAAMVTVIVGKTDTIVVLMARSAATVVAVVHRTVVIEDAVGTALKVRTAKEIALGRTNVAILEMVFTVNLRKHAEVEMEGAPQYVALVGSWITV